jgi:hypothetical protein
LAQALAPPRVWRVANELRLLASALHRSVEVLRRELASARASS